MYSVCAVAIVFLGLDISSRYASLGLSCTYKPHRTPTASRNPQACCRARSSLDTDSFPRCFAESFSTSSGEKYGLYCLTCSEPDASAMLRFGESGGERMKGSKGYGAMKAGGGGRGERSRRVIDPSCLPYRHTTIALHHHIIFYHDTSRRGAGLSIGRRIEVNLRAWHDDTLAATDAVPAAGSVELERPGRR